MKAILLLNTGSPASPDVRGVGRFLFRFLNDRRVIDIPWIFRKLLVNLIIIPMRVRRSSGLYKKMWTPEGSPLIHYGLSLQSKLQQRLGERYLVRYASNYGYPEIDKTIEEVRLQGVDGIVLFPLFPQYASSTTGSVFEKCLLYLSKPEAIPALRTFSYYHNNDLYISALAHTVKEQDYSRYDHIVISFHGLPLSHLRSAHNGESCAEHGCRESSADENGFCYQAACYKTARLLATELGLSEDNYSISFQSRMSRNWLSPFTDETILSLARSGTRSVLVVCPSFTADCLETIVEVGEEYRNLFLTAGGRELVLVPSLNDRQIWVDAIAGMIEEDVSIPLPLFP